MRITDSYLPPPNRWKAKIAPIGKEIESLRWPLIIDLEISTVVCFFIAALGFGVVASASRTAGFDALGIFDLALKDCIAVAFLGHDYWRFGASGVCLEAAIGVSANRATRLMSAISAKWIGRIGLDVKSCFSDNRLAA